MISDQEYLDLTEIGYFLGDLKSKMAQSKPADRVAFAEKYFRKVHSCLHVVGMPYQQIVASNHNRRSFVHCLIQSFSGFADTQMTALDFFHLIEALAPQFPRAVVLEISQCVPVAQYGSGGSHASYSFEDLSAGVFASILFDEWLRLMRDLFVDEGRIGYSKLADKVREFHQSISPSIAQPPLLILAAIEGVEHDMSLEEFKQALFASPALRAEIARLSVLPPAPPPPMEGPGLES
ncbi:hypothetical protein B484DRAFT_395850 [Ochromonadaceae sp. CCMP2298]|nr:hypothetical protein B484DRAFT_396367 [Ochromonadaceae sp. CCMP2298]KAJ1430633.1 hypothetical protein B484DRAFT_395850 [Ochromonadaceae sp. CCMP2298]